MRKVQLTETVLRDANQSLMATRLPYADYEDILPVMDQTGYYSIECWGGATFDFLPAVFARRPVGTTEKAAEESAEQQVADASARTEPAWLQALSR